MNESWIGKWIWVDLPENTSNVYAEARTVFNLHSKIELASLRISANQEYRLFVNGLLVGAGPSPSDNAWKYFDTYDVRDVMQQGENTIAVLAYNFGNAHNYTQQRKGPGGLIVQLDIQTADTTLVIGSGESWKIRRSPRWVEKTARMHEWNAYKEIYLAEQEDGWDRPDYDDSAWDIAIVAAAANDPLSPWPRLIPREIPFLRREDVKPSAVLRTETNYGGVEGAAQLLENGAGAMTLDAAIPGSMPAVVFDFSMEKVGYPVIEVTAPEGGVLHLFYGESLNLTLLDTFILKKGLNRLSPFGRRAFRYVKISAEATPAALTVRDFRVESVRYPFRQEGTFECSDPLLNKIWDIGRYTTHTNSQEHLEDCPYREQALWVVDAVVMGKIIYQTFGDTVLLRKCLLQLSRIQNEDGSIPGTGPERNTQLLPDFNAYWLLGVHDYWRYSGEDEIVLELETPIRRLVQWFKEQEDENGLFSRADRDGWWCFIDWADYIDKRDRVTAISCLYYKVLQSTTELAGVLGDPEFAAECNRRADHLRQAIRTRLWDTEKQLFADCLTEDGLSETFTYQTNFIAVWSDVMTDDEATAFIDGVFKQGVLPELKGAFFYHIVLEVLFSYGYVELALEIIRTFWGGMVARGATTWWETFDPSSPACTIPSPYQGNTPSYLDDAVPVSLCHGWGAAPTYLLTSEILGVNVMSGLPDGTFEFKPALHGLDWVRGNVPTAYGDIYAECVRESNSVSVILKYPDSLSLRSFEGFELVSLEDKEGEMVVRGKLKAKYA